MEDSNNAQEHALMDFLEMMAALLTKKQKWKPVTSMIAVSLNNFGNIGTEIKLFGLKQTRVGV